MQQYLAYYVIFDGLKCENLQVITIPQIILTALFQTALNLNQNKQSWLRMLKDD